MRLTNDNEHADALAEFERLATADEAGNHARLIELRDAIAAYEKANGHEPDLPQTVRGRVELEMFKRRLNQGQLAKLLEIPQSRLSEYLNGRRELNLDLARRLHLKLGIPGDVLLELEPS